MRLYADGLLDELRLLVHPEAEIQMLFLQGDYARGPDGLIDALRAAARTVHSPSATRFEPLDEHAVLMIGRIRNVVERGWTDGPAVWLSVVKDQRIWRTGVFRTAEEARRAYESLYRPLLVEHSSPTDTPEHPVAGRSLPLDPAG